MLPSLRGRLLPRVTRWAAVVEYLTRIAKGWPSSVAPTVARRQSTWAGRRLWTWPLPLNSRQTLKEALSARDGQNSITSVKTDLVWPTLTDDKSDTKGMVLFYEEFEDVCPRQQLSRHECAREVVGAPCPLQGLPPEDVHQRLPGCLEVRRGHLGPRGGVPAHQEQALDFQREPGEEREVRVDGEHVALTKGRLTGHQFEPIFEASIADLEAVGLPPHLQKEIRSDKRLWPGDAKEVGLRSPATWQECHKVVLEYNSERQPTVRWLTLCTPAPLVTRLTLLQPLWQGRRRRSRISRLPRRPRPSLAHIHLGGRF